MTQTNSRSKSVVITHPNRWTNIGDTYVRGSIFIQDEEFKRDRFASRVSSIETKSDLKMLLENATGQYAIIHRNKDGWCIAVDHVRSWPLYYHAGETLVISDSSVAIEERSPESRYDSIACAEYLFTSYVNGSDTLSPAVNQVEPGEIVTITENAEETEIHRSNHFVYAGGESTHQPDFQELEELFANVFQRLIEYADGRPILLPLTGGYDSRLIAAELAKTGYENIVAYTKAPSEGSADLKNAERVAEELGLTHVHLQIEDEDYHEFRISGKWNDFQKSIGYLGELPIVNSHFLYDALESHPEIPDSGILAHGHHALGGASKLPNIVGCQETLSKAEFLHYIWKYSYVRWRVNPFDSNEREIERTLNKRIISQLPDGLYQSDTNEPVQDGVRGIQYYYWRNRLPKYFLIHYEQEDSGYEQWYPLLDREYFEYLQELDAKWQINKRVQKEYVLRRERERSGKEQVSENDFVTSSGSMFTEGVGQTVKSSIWNRSASLFAKSPKPVEYGIKWMYYYTYGTQPGYESKAEFKLVSKQFFNDLNLRVAHRRPIQLLLLCHEGYVDADSSIFISKALANVNKMSREGTAAATDS